MTDAEAEDDTAEIVEGWEHGRPLYLSVREIELGHLLRADLAKQAIDCLLAAREHGIWVVISSAWRSMEKQRELREGWLKGKPGFKPADRPGFSNHQNGTALDLAFRSSNDREIFAAIAIAHGFTRPVHDEPWHFLVSPQEPTHNWSHT